MSDPNPVPFWDSLTIEEIAKLQGITGPTDIDALAGLFTEEEADALLKYLADDRRERGG